MCGPTCTAGRRENEKIVEIVVEMCLCCVTIMETLALFLFLWWTAGCVEFPSSSFSFFPFNLKRKNKRTNKRARGEQKKKVESDGELHLMVMKR